MKTKLFYCVIAILFTNLIFAQTNVDFLWNKSIGGSLDEPQGVNTDARASITVTNTNDVYMVTNTISNDIWVNNSYGSQDCWLVKLNSAGDTLWTKVFGGTDYDAAMGLVALEDEGCVVVGATYSNDYDFTENHDTDGNSTDGFVTRFSADGEIMWSKLYGGTSIGLGFEELYKVIINSVGNIYAVGKTNSINGDFTLDYDKFLVGWVLEVNIDDGEIIECEKIAGKNHSELNANTITDIKQLEDESGYIAIGTQGYQIPDNIWLVKIDNNADTVWTKEFSGSSADNFPRGIAEDEDGNYIIASWVTDGGGDITTSYGESEIWVFKTNATGEIITQNTFGGSDIEMMYTLAEDNKGGYLISGTSRSSDNYAPGEILGENDFYLINFDNNLDSIFTYKTGGSETDALTGVAAALDGETIYLTGKTKSNDYNTTGNNGGVDIWIANIDPIIIPVNIDNENVKNLNCYPNPATKYILIENNIDEKIDIIDIFGKIVISKTIISNKEIINIEQLSSGIYFIKTKSETIKLVVSY